MTTEPVTAAALPPGCADADAALRALLACASAADEWDAPTRQAVLAWLAKQRDLLAAVEARVLTAEREAGTWSLRGDRDLAGFVGRQTRSGRGAGLAAIAQAGTLAAMPTVADALVDGPVTATHVAQLTRATAASPSLAAGLATPEGQAQVVELAGRLDGSEFGKALAQLSASVDRASRQRSHDEQRATRSFAWTHTRGGTLVKGRLDSVAGHKLAKVINALCPRPALDDERSREMRQADALLAIVERTATDRTTTPGSVAPVQAVLTLTQETWAALRGERATARTVGRSAGEAEREDVAPAAGRQGAMAPATAVGLVGRPVGVAPVTDESGQAWPASEIARALCDCALTRAVLGAPDAELNLGRESRAFTRRHWLALYAAGFTGCSIDGCGMPLAYCELHHLQWWYQHGGLTNIANCAPYCSYHHHEIHRLGIAITRQADGSLEHRHPDGRPYGGAPPGATPSAGTPAFGTPPIGTPPVETALVGTPPVFGTPAVGTARTTSVPGPDCPAGVPPAAQPPPGGSSDAPPGEPPGDLLELLSA